MLVFKNSKATSLVVCQEDIPPEFCIPCHLHQTFQYHQILSHHCSFGEELVGCWEDVCVEHVCPFTGLCLTDVQDLKQDLENGEREGFKMAFSSPKQHRDSTLFPSSLRASALHCCCTDSILHTDALLSCLPKSV